MEMTGTYVPGGERIMPEDTRGYPQRMQIASLSIPHWVVGPTKLNSGKYWRGLYFLHKLRLQHEVRSTVSTAGVKKVN